MSKVVILVQFKSGPVKRKIDNIRFRGIYEKQELTDVNVT